MNSRLSHYFSKNVISFMALNPIYRNAFSAQAVAEKNFRHFRKEYEGHVKQFYTKVEEIETNNIKKWPRPMAKGYEHQFNSDHHPLNFSPVKTAELFHDFIGPEQVSPHYENFLVSRKYLMAFWAGFFLLNAGVATVDLNWIMKASFIPLIFWISYLYFYIEGRKAFLKPLLVRFYRRASANEQHMFEAYYHENIENKLREQIRIAKGQLDYWNLHSNFREIKAESINNFLANEYQNLHNHINQRAQNILVQAKTCEEQNRNRILQKILDDAVAELNNAVSGEKAADVQKKMLDAAIEGLSKGQMDYANDPLLPLILGSIRKNVSQFQNLSEAEQSKLVQLTKEQIQSIKQSDKQLKQEFLRHEPEGIDASLKSQETVKKILDNWGK